MKIDQIIDIGEQCSSLIKFLESHDYEIPGYQRDYAWEKDNFEDLIDDILDSMERKSEHFFGVLMTMPKEGTQKTRLIIDGQQRITTSLIFLKSLQHYIDSEGIKKDQSESRDKVLNPIKRICNASIGFITSDDDNLRLKISGHNQEIFEKIMVDGATFDEISDWCKSKKGDLPNTTIRMFEAFEYFYRYFKELEGDFNDYEKFMNRVSEICGFFFEHFKILHIPIQSNIFAYQFFQTVNDRGKDLVVSDIIKAYFHELCSENKDKESRIESYWLKITENLGNSATDTFLRHYWLSKECLIKANDLLGQIKTNYDTYAKADNFLKQLVNESENYKNLLSINTDSEELNEELRNTFILAENFVLPCLLSARQTMGDKEMVDFVKVISIFVFRYRTICHLENKNMERVLSEVAVNLRKNPSAFNLKNVVSKLKKIDVNDDQFSTIFKSYSTKNNKIAKYILEKLELHKRGNKVNKEPWDPKMSVEHILPKKYETYWTEFLSDKDFDPSEYIYRLGNLTLLTSPLNSGIKNQIFKIKKEEIEKNCVYKINKFVTQQDVWDSTTINLRQLDFSDVALKIWNLNKFL
jgi:uncharacterized protein with ParB-like and HNH nuclease domain